MLYASVLKKDDELLSFQGFGSKLEFHVISTFFSITPKNIDRNLTLC